MRNLHISLLLITSILISCKPSPTSAAKTGQRSDVNVAEAHELINEHAAELIILDVRTPEESASGTIANARLMDFRDIGFESHIDELDNSKTYLVYCAGGSRSTRAVDLMVDKGFKNVYNLLGGYDAWQESNE